MIGKFKENFDPIANSPHGKHDVRYDKSGLGKTHQTDKVAFSKYGEQEAGILQGYEMTYTGEREALEHKKFKEFVDGLTGKEIFVDLGAGLGSAMIHFLQKHGKAKNIISVDLDFENARALLTTYPETINSLGDAAKAPLRSNSVDVLVCQYIMADNHMNIDTKIKDIKKEISRIVRPGGVLITNEDLDYGDIVDRDVFEYMFFFNPAQAGATFYRKKE